MQIKVNKKEKSQFELEVEIPQDTVKEVFSRAFKRVAQQVEVPGFRKGKVPRKIFEQRYGKEPIEDEAFKELYLRAYNKIVSEEKITPLAEPRVEVIKFSEEEPAILKFQIPVEPEVQLGNYKKIKVKRNKIKVEEKEIEQQLKSLQKELAEYPPLLENRPTQEGDWLALEVRALSPDIYFDGTKKEENFWYKLGSDQLPPVFHEKLLGANIGDERIVETIVPPDHPRKSIAGKKLSFNVKVKDIRAERLPPIDDELAKNLNFENIQSLKEWIGRELEKLKNKKEEDRIKKEILAKIIKGSKVDIPPLLVERGIENKMRRLEEELQKNGMTFSEYLEENNTTEEKIKEFFKAQTENELKLLFILEEIARKEDIKVTPEEIDKNLESMVQGENKEAKVKNLKRELIKRGRLGGFIQRIRDEKVIDFLYQQADVSGVVSSD